MIRVYGIKKVIAVVMSGLSLCCMQSWAMYELPREVLSKEIFCRAIQEYSSQYWLQFSRCIQLAPVCKWWCEAAQLCAQDIKSAIIASHQVQKNKMLSDCVESDKETVAFVNLLVRCGADPQCNKWRNINNRVSWA